MKRKYVLHAEHLEKTFGRGPASVHAVRDVSVAVEPGELVVIMGPSGSGKTTLVSMLGTLLSPDAGTVQIDGAETTTMSAAQLAGIRARKIGFIFQAFNLLDALTAEQNILFPAGLVSRNAADSLAYAGELQERLGLIARRKALPKTLSGGEKQRVAVARALINRPSLIFADEPTGNLDSQSGLEVVMLLHDIARDEECSVVLVTHDQRITEIADRLLWLEDGALRDRKSEPRSWVTDPVCGMRVDQWTATLVAEYETVSYAFCSQRCLDRFRAQPKEYLHGSPGHA